MVDRSPLWWPAAAHLDGYILATITIGRVDGEPPITAVAASAVRRGKAPSYGPSIKPPGQMYIMYILINITSSRDPLRIVTPACTTFVSAQVVVSP